MEEGIYFYLEGRLLGKGQVVALGKILFGKVCGLLELHKARPVDIISLCSRDL